MFNQEIAKKPHSFGSGSCSGDIHLACPPRRVLQPSRWKSSHYDANAPKFVVSNEEFKLFDSIVRISNIEEHK